MNDRSSLRRLFDRTASDYDASRPGYPEQVFTDILSLSAIPPDGQMLEIGCGTGQATLPFARRGYPILCLDIGPDLLAIAAENLRGYPNVQFETCSFEAWQALPESFDLVYAATSFHWIPPEIGYPKAAYMLKPGGSLAVFVNRHPQPFTGFFREVQSVYQRCAPGLVKQGECVKMEAEIEQQSEDIRATGLFASVDVRTYPWSVSYTSEAYIRLLNTYSDHLALEEGQRDNLYRSIARLIDENYAGKVERPYLTILYLGKKAPEGTIQ